MECTLEKEYACTFKERKSLYYNYCQMSLNIQEDEHNDTEEPEEN
jgi:hypothetical protein